MKGNKLGDKAAAAEGKSLRGTRRQRQPKAAQNGDDEGRQAWETRRQRQPKPAQNGDHEGRQAKGSPE